MAIPLNTVESFRLEAALGRATREELICHLIVIKSVHADFGRILYKYLVDDEPKLGVNRSGTFQDAIAGLKRKAESLSDSGDSDDPEDYDPEETFETYHERDWNWGHEHYGGQSEEGSEGDSQEDSDEDQEAPAEAPAKIPTVVPPKRKAKKRPH